MNTRFVLIPKSVVAAIHCARSLYKPYETGGFLIGLRRGPHIEVTSLTEQAKGDIATRASFERIGPAHRERIHAAWRASSGRETLVGDWHSHPDEQNVPSLTDQSTWLTLARNARRPMLGIIDSGAAMPSLFLATERSVPFATELLLREECADIFAFA